MDVSNGAGNGSLPRNVSVLLDWIPELINEYHVIRINDAGCGRQVWIPDDRWGVDYRGYDKTDYGNNVVLDIARRKMRKANLIICKDVFRHMDIYDIKNALYLFDAKLLLADMDVGAAPHVLADTPLDLGELMGPAISYRKSPEHPTKYFGLWSLE